MEDKTLKPFHMSFRIWFLKSSIDSKLELLMLMVQVLIAIFKVFKHVLLLLI